MKPLAAGPSPVSAEYAYYRSLLVGDPGPAPAHDFDEWIRVLGTEKDFERGGRYAVVKDTLGNAARVSRLLEVGCGSGVALAYMSRWAEEAVGADIFLVPHLRAPQPPGISFVEFNANGSFPFPDGHFSAFVAMMVMEHVFDPFHFCAEAARVLAKGGLIFLNVPLVTALRHRVAILRGRVPETSKGDWFGRKSWDGGHLHYFSLPLLVQLIEFSGFDLSAVRCPGRASRLKEMWPTLLAAEISVVARKR